MNKKTQMSQSGKRNSFFAIIKEELISDIKYIIEHQLFFTFLLLSFAALVYLAKPPPPRHIVMLTGASGMAYSQYAAKYKKYFSENGFDLELVPTNGSAENVKRLNDPNDTAQVGFIQGGTANLETAKNISTLGSLFYEPVWLFYRGPKQREALGRFKEFIGQHINIGAPESGTNALAHELLKLNKIENWSNLLQLPTQEAIEDLNSKKIDGVFLVDTQNSENIRRLIQNNELQLVNFTRSEAYSYAVDHLDKLIIPMGGLDLARNFPSEDTHLIATTAELVVKNNVHPAIQLLLLQAATEIHGGESYFNKRGEFPALKRTLLPVSEEAKIFYKNGSPYLTKILPFWAAEFLGRMWFYIPPLLILAFPVFTAFWEYRIYRGRRKINAIYYQLKLLEREVVFDFSSANASKLLEKIEGLEYETLNLRLPREVSGEYYLLRKNIDYVRDRIYSQEKSVDGGHFSVF